MNIVIPLTVMAAILLLAGAITILFQERLFRSGWARRISNKPKAKVRHSFTWNVSLRSLANLLSMLGRAVKPDQDNEISRIKISLIKAGYWGGSASAIFLGTRIVLSALLPAITMLFTFKPYLIIAAAAAGYCLPYLWLRWMIARRKERIRKGLPDALDLLVICTEAGQGLDSAISRISQKLALGYKDLSDELRIVALEQRAGRSRQEALRNFARRVGLEEVNNLVALLIQTDKFGTSISQVLRVHAEFARSNKQRRVEALANKLPMKLTFPLIFFIFPSLFAVLLGPVVVRAVRTLGPVFGRGLGMQ